ncbi:MAG: hypothetical protein IPK80_29850 [Nannocystis sp.]|nr:hypothetical protein [Nannocystis sp.]
MEYRCARCHAKFSVEGGEVAHACPRCKAEAGLDPVMRKVPLPMVLFGAFLSVALVATVVGGILSRGGG